MITQALFEISWEVCNKVGGIYTVLRSKVPFIVDKYEEYVLLGPQLGKQEEFDPRPVPDRYKSVFKTLEGRGVKCLYGVWLVPGEPAVILIDSSHLLAQRNDLKFQLWEKYKIDSMNASWEFDEPLCFSTAAGMLVEEYEKQSKKKIVVQCHEWMAGFALLHLKRIGSPVGTVFTTHATILGRTIAGNRNSLYEIMDKIDPKEWAYKYNVQDKHLSEVACAHAADVFTTVSEITGMEAEYLLGKKPDVLLLNGFSIDQFPTFEETSLRHNQSRDFLYEFIAYSFFPYYAFDLQKTLIVFTSGRYEFQNKGMDVLVEALGRVNERLKVQHTDITIVVFFWVIMDRGAARTDLIQNKNSYIKMKSVIEWQSKPLMQKIMLDFLSGHMPGSNDVFTTNFLKAIRQEVRHIKRSGNPPISTHAVDAGDPIVNSCMQHGLHNTAEDKVKVILYPGYLEGNDNLLNLQYYDATVGAHLGVFPSSYEPWGYTPLESAVLGVPAITTDLAGFGRYMQIKNPQRGVFVLQRYKRSYEDAVAQLAEVLHTYASFTHDERVQQGFAAKTLSGMCNWKDFVANYFTAHNLAAERGCKW